MMATPGERGQERVLQLELRTMAHAGLVGFPNAGKSSLLWAISNSRPAWALLSTGTMSKLQCLVADIPCIIHGAHLNRGLGISFLRHIECCCFLLFVLDLSSPEPWTQLQHLRFKLDQYEPDSPTGPTLSWPTKWTCLGLGGKWTPSGATWPRG
uniref:Mitochondrial ribosome associated GTPase 2 n=1 Tax=Hucho hucho TaxID=62062 RepID=A0A4W5N532_9TELE